MYDAGPDGSPHLYDRRARHGIRFLPEETGTAARHDLPRNSQGVALIGDPRDDENLVIGQLQVGFLKFHDAAVEHVTGLTAPGATFAEAQRIVRWHYRRTVIHQFLKKICGEAVVESVLEQRRFHDWESEPFIPMEFSATARCVRPIAPTSPTTPAAPFFAMICTSTPSDPDDLSGRRRASRHFIDWQTYFDFHDGKARPDRMIDAKLSSALFARPGSMLPHPDPVTNPQSLAQRNLLRFAGVA